LKIAQPVSNLQLAMILAALVIAFTSGVAPAQPSAQAPSGLWDASMQTLAGSVDFAVELTWEGDQLKAALLNASDRQQFTSATWDGRLLTLRFDYYDGTLTARRIVAEKMEGEYSRQTSHGIVHLPLTMAPHRDVFFDKPWVGPSLTGEWTFHRPGEQGTERITLAEFQQQKVGNADGQVIVTGIFEPVSGDTGLLHGFVFRAEAGSPRFHLSRFDGIHVLAFDGEFLPDGRLKGQIGSGKSGISPFTATRSNQASGVDPNVQGSKLTRVSDPQQAFRFSGSDASGKTLDQNSPEFKGKALIIDIFGTWCPNCHDEAPVLEKIYERYRGEGLVIVGLAYEYTADQARDQRLMEIYRAKYGLSFPMLLAGTTADGQIAQTLPQLIDFGAYPTTIFLDRQGRVHAIHAGFSGPATGERYQQVQQRFDALTREIVGSAN
jgi:thiol-disulfide isomerase/thioredoxin